MPTVYEGIGTWYYGKRRIHRFKGTCSFCNRVGELASYDTTLYCVFFHVPLLPLGQKRVLEACPSCGRHRVVKLREWEAAKAQSIARLLEKLDKEPDDRDTTRQAIALACSYQDGALFEKLATSLAKDRLEDAGIQSQLGAAYAYFARWPEAEAAYRAALSVEDNLETCQQLALALLKQGRPEDAAGYLRHVLDNQLKEQAGLIYLLIEGYQAQGMHQEALAISDRRDAAFPDLASQKEFKKQRKTSQRYLHSGKKIKSAYLSESAKTGYREGSWTARIPRLIGPLVVLGLLAWYLGAALWTGQARKIYLVNGWNKPYTVAVNGREHSLPPEAATAIHVPEGEITIEFQDAKAPMESVRCRVESPFFSRPFSSRTYVINPDQLAVLLKEQTEYGEVARPIQLPPELHVGKVLYALDGIDYEFTAFPPTLQGKKGETFTKTRVDVARNLASEARLSLVTRGLPDQEQIDYAKRWLNWEPNDVITLYLLLGRLSNEEALAFLNTRLNVRPVLVEWHRAYQDLSRKSQPETDLLPTYRQLVAQTADHPDALYLLARVQEQNLDEADALLRRAAGANPPSAYAMHALGYQALEQGRFDDAVSWEEKAFRLAPQSPSIERGYRQALLAARKYDRLLEHLRTQPQTLTHQVAALTEQIRVYTAKGDLAKARATILEAAKIFPGAQPNPAQQQVQAHLELLLCCCQHDVAGFLKVLPQIQDISPFEPAFLRGKLQEAARLVGPENDQALVRLALLYLAAVKDKNQKLAEDQWQELLAALSKGRAPLRTLGEMLAGRRPIKEDQIRRLPIEVEQKRVLLAVVARRFPNSSKELLPLARKLDFSPDVTSLCLQKILD
jgi:tetratricopeptide (TPR) repeat protein